MMHWFLDPLELATLCLLIVANVMMWRGVVRARPEDRSRRRAYATLFLLVILVGTVFKLLAHLR